MPAALLTVDLGNTSAKLRLWDGAEDRRPECLAERTAPARTSGAALAEALASLVSGAPPGTVGALSSVAGPELEARVVNTLADALGDGWLGAPPAGVLNRCRDPETVGSDRLFAARGAAACLSRSALVVDAGTALTVDAVEHPGDGSAPRFLGGAIAPGPGLAAASLADGAARLPRVEPRGGVPALGLDTPSALAAGLLWGFRGAAAELVRRIAAEAGLGAAPVALAGGARALLLEPPLFDDRELVDLPDLVHVGLYEAALDVLGALGAGAGGPDRTGVWSPA